LRPTSGIRNLVRETRLDLDDFVMPLFVGPEAFPNDELPGLRRHSIETLVAEAEELERLGVRAVILSGSRRRRTKKAPGPMTTTGSCSGRCVRSTARASCASRTSVSASTRRTATAG
jgi:porphobilinogen synthase